MRVLWVGDAVVDTGFARCTHAACEALHAAGHEVHVLGINYFGDPHQHPFSIYPCRQPLDGGRDSWGVTRLPALVERLQPDVVVILQDPWNIPDYMRSLTASGIDIPPVVGWLAVDGLNQHGRDLRGLSLAVAWCEFGAEELRRGGYEGPLETVPLGVDAERFQPHDKRKYRELALPGLPPDAFLLGAVGRNQPRKRLDLTIEYFAEWLNRYSPEDAYLYLHVAPTGDSGVNVPSLCRYYGVANKVILADPRPGHGLREGLMAQMYSAFDLYVTTSQGEGWGLPCLEAMACGVPCVVPDWAALGDWPGDAVRRVRCSGVAPTAPMNSQCHTLGGIADKGYYVTALQELYSDKGARLELARRGRELAAGLSWRASGEGMVAVLEAAAARGADPWQQ